MRRPRGGDEGPAAVWGLLAVHLSQQMDVAQHRGGSGMRGQVIWGGLLQLMVPAGAPLIRSAAMVAVIKAKVFGYLQVLLSPFLWLAGSV